MAAGSSPAGAGPAGLSPISDPGPAPTPPPDAIYYDPFARGFSLDADGQLIGIHPVDQAVALALGIELGSIAAVPELGIDLARLRRATRAAMQDTVNDVVAAALAPLLATGDVELIGSPLMADANGRPWFFVDYRNLRLPGAPRQPAVAVKR